MLTLYKIVQVFFAILIVLLSLAVLLILFVDWEQAAPLAVVLSVLVGAFASLSAAIRRSRELLRGSPAAPPAVLAATLAGAPPILCYTLTRGTGQLHLDENGSLHFLADAVFSGWWWPPRAVRRRSQAERSLIIPRDQVRVAVPFDHLAAGPSMVVGLATPGNGLSWEEFILATRPSATNQFPQPTGDARIWARALAPAEGSAQLQKEAARYRQRLRRRMSLSLWGLTTMVVTVALVPLIYGLIALAAADKGSGTVLGALAIGGAIWLASVLFIGLLIFAANR